MAQPFSLTLTFSYDAASNRTQVLDNKGGTFASSYDVLDRLSSRSLDTSTGDVRVDYAYTVRDRIDTVSRFTNLAGTISAGTSKSTYDSSDRSPASPTSRPTPRPWPPTATTVPAD